MLLVAAANWLTRSDSPPPLWSPAAGLGLALVAWLGWRFAVGVLLGAGLVVVVLSAVLGAVEGTLTGSSLVYLALLGILDAAEPAFAWWMYHQKGKGSRRLADPGSATLFVFLVPGVAAALSALLRAVLTWGYEPADGATLGFSRLLVLFWLARALGMLILGPPLLVIVTPWLLRRGFIQGEQVSERQGEWDRSGTPPAFGLARAETGAGSRWGDQIETIGLALSASILCLLLGRLQGRRDLFGWQLWGVQILLIVWASVRQGLCGGTLVAAAAAAVPLLARQLWPRDEDLLFRSLLQGHLLAQCAAAVLVAAAASWVRIHENGYRQIVGHIPVVIYSARLLPAAEGKRQKEEGKREEKSGDAFSLLPSPRAEVTLVSAASGRLLGRPAEELLGPYDGWLDLVFPEDRVVVLAALEQLTRQEQPVTCEYRVPADPGSGKNVRWLRDTLAPQRDARPAAGLGWGGHRHHRAARSGRRPAADDEHVPRPGDEPAGRSVLRPGTARPTHPGQRACPAVVGTTRGRFCRAGVSVEGVSAVPARRNAVPSRGAAGVPGPAAGHDDDAQRYRGASARRAQSAAGDLGSPGVAGCPWEGRTGRRRLGAGGLDSAAPGGSCPQGQ
jgi:integral membrane sensor domain MASE1